MPPTHLISRQLFLCRTSRQIWLTPICAHVTRRRVRPSNWLAYSTNRDNEPTSSSKAKHQSQSEDKSTKTKKRRPLLKWIGLSIFGVFAYFVDLNTPEWSPLSLLGFSSATQPKIFDRPRFTPFTVVSREEVSPTNIILTLRPFIPTPPTSDPYLANWEQGTWSVEFKQPQLQIARSYTPLPPTSNTQNGDLRFLIKREHKGEVSGYLHGLPVGAKVDLRGPHQEIEIPREVTDVVFLAGGTGIAPALQVVYTLLEARRDREVEDGRQPRIRILWANRRREECEGGKNNTLEGASLLWKPGPTSKQEKSPSTLVQELQELQRKHEGRVTVDYLVDEEGMFIDQKRITQLIRLSNSGAVSSVKSLPRHESIDKKLIFVSGPEGFVSFFAGPKKWEGGKEGQGEVGGIIGRMRLRDWKLWKL